MNFLVKIFLGLQVLLIILYYLFSKPQYEGTVLHSFKNYSDVHIHREKQHGVPHIVGNTIVDTCFGQGYVHAQDRLFQMHQKRLFASGRLAEFLGEKLVDVDKMMRQLGLKRLAQETIDMVPKETLDCLQAYSDGINLYVSESKFLPLEFQIFKMNGMQWEEWTPVDTIVQGKLLTWMVTIDHVYEFIRTKLAKIVKEEKAREYFGIGGENQFIDTVILNDEELQQSGIYEKYQKKTNELDVGDLFKDILLDYKDIQEINETPGSNSWVIDGKHTYSGKPILGNDPHLPNNMPTIWYQNEILYEENGKQKYSIGVSIPGMPSIFIGKTDYFAWGVTILMADISDYYVEKIDYQNKTYEVDNQQKKLTVQMETIKVKGQDDIQFERLLTHRGAIMSFMFNKNLPNPIQKIPDVSFAWVGGEKDNFHSVLLNLQKANTESELIKIAHDMPGPGCTVVYATEDDKTGFIGVGRKPLRNNQKTGAFLNDGSSSLYDWQGYSDPTEWPQVRNPKKGYIITANNRFATDNLKHQHSLNQFSTSRASRIEELFKNQLQNGKKFTIQDMFDFQADTVDIFAEKVIKGLMKLYDSVKNKVLNTEQLKETESVINYLKNWNGDVKVESIGASVFAAWMYKFQTQIFEFHKVDLDREAFTLSIHLDQFLFKKLDQFIQNPEISQISEEWCTFKENTNCIANLFDSLAQVNQFLKQKLGNDWRQGLLHKQQFPHHVFSKTPLNVFYDREFRGFGNHRTVAVAIQKLGAHDFNSAYGSNYRQVIDFAENSKSYWVIDTGISESMFSQYYDDQQKLHEKFEYFEMKFGKSRLGEYELKKSLLVNKN